MDNIQKISATTQGLSVNQTTSAGDYLKNNPPTTTTTGPQKIAPAIIAGGIQVLGMILNGIFTSISNQKNRDYQNQLLDKQHKLNEEAADAADARQRAQYNDMYSPEAQVNALKAAGLSPALFYGGGNALGGGSAHGAQGPGTTAGTPIPYANPMQGITDVLSVVSQAKLNDALAKQATANADKTESDNRRADEQQPWIVKGLVNETQVQEATARLMSANAENVKAQTALTNFQAEYQALENYFKEATLNDDIALSKGRLEKMAKELHLLENECNKSDESWKIEVATLKQNYWNSVKQGMILQAQKSLIEAQTTKTNAEVQLTEAEMKKVEQAILNMKAEELQKIAETEDIKKRTEMVEKYFWRDTINMGLNQVQNTFRTVAAFIPFTNPGYVSTTETYDQNGSYTGSKITTKTKK